MDEIRLRVRLFGGFDLTYLDQPVGMGHSPRLQALLALLLLHAGAPLARQQVAWLLWPDSPEAHARNSLRNLLHQLRHTLPEADHYLLITADTLCWRLGTSYELDVAAFERGLARALAANDAAARHDLAAAVAWYTGDLFPSCYAEWIAEPRARLRQALAGALERLAGLYSAAGEHRLALAAAERLCQHEPLEETSYALLMRCAGAEGDLALVHATYRRAARVLDAELGVEPGPALQDTYAALTAQVQPAQASQPVQPHLPVRLARAERPLPPGGAGVGSPRRGPVAQPLVGRQAELARLQQAWRALTPGRAQVVLVSGEPGIGKSRVVEELAQWVALGDRPTLQAHCYAGGGALAFAPVAEWLRSPVARGAITRLDGGVQRDLARLLPELRTRRPGVGSGGDGEGSGEGSGDEHVQRRRLFEAMASALLALPQPILLCLNDWQWCDWETLEWLDFLLNLAGDQAVLIAGTVRREEVSRHARLQSLLLTWRQLDRLTEIKLDPLDEAETLALAQQVTGHAVDAAHGRALAEATEGNPLFIIEYLRAYPEQFTGADEAALGDGGGRQQHAVEDPGAPVALPGKVQATIEYRLAQLTPAALDLAGLAAVAGRRFELTLLASAGGLEEGEIVRGLDELAQRGIVREVAAGVYEFTHDKLREVAYLALSATRRQHTHRSIGQVYAMQAEQAVDALATSTRAAWHCERGNSLDRAVRFYQQAAALTAGLYAYHRAAELYGSAAAVAGKLNLPAATLLAIYSELGRMYEHAGDYERAIDAYRRLEAVALQRADKALEARAVARLATAFAEPSSTHNLVQAQAMLARGLALAQALGDYDLEAHLLWSKLVMASHYGDDTTAWAAGEASLALCRAHGLDATLPYVLNDLAINLRLSGRQADGQRYAEEARALFAAAGNRQMLADNYTQQAWHEFHQLRLAECLHWAEQGAALSREIDNGWNLALATAIRGLVAMMQGAWGDALADLEQSMRVGEAAGFAIAVTLVPALLALLLQRIGCGERAGSLLQTAHEAALHQAPFTLALIEALLAGQAYAEGQPAEGERWLRGARFVQAQGAIGRAWLMLGAIPEAAVAGAQATGGWVLAGQLVRAAQAEAGVRQLPVYLPVLALGEARCLLAEGQAGVAEARLHSLVALAEGAGLTPIGWQAELALAGLYRGQARQAEAAAHQQRAAEHVRTLAASLPDDALRHAFLASAAVRGTFAVQ